MELKREILTVCVQMPVSRFGHTFFFSDLCVGHRTDFVQAKHQVRIDSVAGRRMLTSTIKAKVLRDKTERQNTSRSPAHALVIWQRHVMP